MGALLAVEAGGGKGLGQGERGTCSKRVPPSRSSKTGRSDTEPLREGQADREGLHSALDRVRQAACRGTTIDTFAVDALGRRITENPGAANDLYYSNLGQVLEQQQGSTVVSQNIWGVDYVNDLVLRDDNANFNLTALTDSTGAVDSASSTTRMARSPC